MATTIPSSDKRFTLDGDTALERRLTSLCEQALEGVRAVVPSRQLEALVLGGGYGRGEGGVLKTSAGDQPYNDLDFYVFTRGSHLLHQRKFGAGLDALGHRLSAQAGLHVEFKLDSLAKLRRSSVSMFSYDLVARHRTFLGSDDVFCGCEHHLNAAQLPLAEATRLLFNRCTGLLLVKEMLRGEELSAEHGDFIGRNLAKAQLALGDAVLTAFGQYHWSCTERHHRLLRLASPELFSRSQPSTLNSQLLCDHAAGLEFKLHPRRIRKPAGQFEAEHGRISELALQLWLWLEGRRLKCSFSSACDYALAPLGKCSGVPRWQNILLNLRTLGPTAALGPMAWRYPRERLLNSLPLLLWNADLSLQPPVLRRLQQQLHTAASEWSGLVGAYKRIWPSYG